MRQAGISVSVTEQGGATALRLKTPGDTFKILFLEKEEARAWAAAIKDCMSSSTSAAHRAGGNKDAPPLFTLNSVVRVSSDLGKKRHGAGRGGVLCLAPTVDLVVFAPTEAKKSRQLLQQQQRRLLSSSPLLRFEGVSASCESVQKLQKLYGRTDAISLHQTKQSQKRERKATETGLVDKRTEAAADLWTIAAELFAMPPYSNGGDSRYEEVKAELRAKFGHDAINSSNKERLKDLAKARGAHTGSTSPTADLWSIAAARFAVPPYSKQCAGAPTS